MRTWPLILIVWLIAPLLHIFAHEMRPGYLQVEEVAPQTFDVVWKVPARSESDRLALNVRFADDVENIGTPVEGFINNAYFLRWRVRCPVGLEGTPITIEGLESIMTDVLLRLEWEDGTSLTHRLTPEAPTYVVAERPSWAQVAWTYFVLGVDHILGGIDHLMFVFALLLITTGTWRLVKTITAFTVAHSITLSAAALGFVTMPSAPVEAVIALSIVFLATEIVHSYRGTPGLAARKPWIVSFAFGLLHGFGFAGALSEIGLPQTAIPLALFNFNVGVEVGQLMFVAVVLAAAWLLARVRIAWPVWARLGPVYAIGGIAAFWCIQRVAAFWA